VGDLDALRERLAASGAAIDAPGKHSEGFREIVVADPDGNRLRLFDWQN
jgi:predicted enzyme related to lactoylglutathione lyase